MKQLQKDFKLNTKYLLPMAMLYITFSFTSTVVAFRFYSYHGLAISASGLIYPLTFFISDAIAEVYGYQTARKVVWITLISSIVFASLIEVLIRLPLHSDPANTHAFIASLGSTLRFILSCIVGDIVGIFLNIYLVSKWKVKWKGRWIGWFGVRSLLSTGLGELSMTFISIFLAFSSYNNLGTNLRIALTTYGVLLIYACIMVWPTWLLATILKRKEGIDVIDTKINYNPFRFN